jgi:glycosyltransferase involved in cell wall biosynthesis
MKIAVTSIAKNEEQFVERWARSAKDADLIILIDTGSTDNTVEWFTKFCDQNGINGVCHSITIDPWRFDHARNAGQALIPNDVDWVIDLDLDEVLVDGWRQELEKSIEEQPHATRFRYQFVWSWNDDGTPAVQFNSDKIRTRKNYFWKHPVHECLYFWSNDERQIESFGNTGVKIYHFPDETKPRSQYIDLLKHAVTEQPNDDRMAHYYARELYFYNRFVEAMPEFERHLTLGKWEPERAMSMCYMARIYHAWKQPDKAIKTARLAVAENPNARETWMTMADVSHFNGQHMDCFHAVVQALRITEHPMLYMSDPKAWGSHLYDIGSVSAYSVGNLTVAIDWCSKALSLDPNNDRIKMNLEKLEGEKNDRNNPEES